MKKIVLGFACLVFVAAPVAEAAKMKPAVSCKVVAKKAADNAGNGRVFSAAMGGFTGLIIGSILSENNPKGEKRAGGLFGGGQLGGKAYRAQWQRDYNKAYANCRR